MVNYEDLRLLVDCAAQRSLSKVAELYDTTEPAVSRRITKFELSYGGRLFTRTGRGVTLNAMGKQILPQIIALLDESVALDNDLHRIFHNPVGQVTLGCIPSSIKPVAASLYDRILRSYPLIRLVILEGHEPQLERWLANGDIDMALMYRVNDESNQQTVDIFKTNVFLIERRDLNRLHSNTVEFANLSQFPLVLFAKPSRWRTHLDSIARQHGVDLQVRAEVDSLTLQIELVIRMKLAALLGPFAVQLAEHTGTIRHARVVRPEIRRSICIQASPHIRQSLAHKMVVATIRKILSELHPIGRHP